MFRVLGIYNFEDDITFTSAPLVIKKQIPQRIKLTNQKLAELIFILVNQTYAALRVKQVSSIHTFAFTNQFLSG